MNPNTSFPPPSNPVARREPELEPEPCDCSLCLGEGLINDRGRLVRCPLCEGDGKRPLL